MTSRLFAEYAALPDVFDPAVYESPSEHRALLSSELQRRLDRCAFLRGLRGQEWLIEVSRISNNSIAAQKLLKWLISNKRLLPSDNQGGEDWLDEARMSHTKKPLDGLILGCAHESHKQLPPSARLADIREETWWAEAVSCQVNRDVPAIIKHLELLLLHGRIILFVDPFLNPCANLNKLEDFQLYLDCVAQNTHQSAIEIHSSTKVFENESLVYNAADRLRPIFRKRRLDGYLYVWNPRDKVNGMHDRYLLTDVGGCQLGAGFEWARNQAQIVTVLDNSLRKNLMTSYDPSPNYARGLEYCVSLV